MPDPKDRRRAAVCRFHFSPKYQELGRSPPMVQPREDRIHSQPRRAGTCIFHSSPSYCSIYPTRALSVPQTPIRTWEVGNGKLRTVARKRLLPEHCATQDRFQKSVTRRESRSGSSVAAQMAGFVRPWSKYNFYLTLTSLVKTRGNGEESFPSRTSWESQLSSFFLLVPRSQ